ncbi:hypothetical protein QBC36DRAFT_306392 [Triangularia setosa]|uniref:Uncharacterized protein n=1 Tax=Triangularia setosa TaxID=2587417 RepID=A0AAN7AD47_9PEZI|nr:hypothetical protein QBC36DRAFT_306392 [Podospora setosa]
MIIRPLLWRSHSLQLVCVTLYISVVSVVAWMHCVASKPPIPDGGDAGETRQTPVAGALSLSTNLACSIETSQVNAHLWQAEAAVEFSTCWANHCTGLQPSTLDLSGIPGLGLNSADGPQGDKPASNRTVPASELQPRLKSTGKG